LKKSVLRLIAKTKQPQLTKMKRVLIALAALCGILISNFTYAQPGNMEGDFVSGTWNTTQTLTDLGTFRQYRAQRSGATGNGNFLFNASPGTYGTQWTGSNAPNFVRSVNTYHNGGAFYYTGGGWNTDLQVAMTNSNYYTFNFLENGAANSSIEILETTYNPVTLSGLTRTAGDYGTHVFTVTASSAPSAGENVFLRYSTNGYTNSTLVQFTFVGTTGTATVPAQAPNATLVAYAYSSNKSQASIESDVTGNGQSAHDLATLNLSNGVSYAVPNNPVIVTSTAGSAAGVATGYATMQAAFTAINGGAIHLGVITIGLIGNTTEAASAVLNQVAGVTSVGIQPAGGAARSISGAVTGHLIDLNGADNVTVNGLNASSNSLTITNTATGASSAIRFIADATNNTIQNCTVEGSASSINNAVIFFSGGTTTGNDTNTITGCTIKGAGSNLPLCGILSLGTSAALDNAGMVISNNNITDFFSAGAQSFGLYLNNTNANSSSGWTVTNNKFYQTGARLYTTANTHSAILIGGGSGYTLTDNVIGFANSSGTGTYTMVGNSVALSGTFPSAWNNTGTANSTRFIGMNLAFAAGGAVSSIQNNTIAGFALYTNSGASTTNGIWCGIAVMPILEL
jgi:trimeric autotransporter adhesin